MKTIKRRVIWITLFSIAMGFLETAVVVYLRELYYPDGFGFPLVPIEPTIAITEFWREVATLVMLAGIGILTGRNVLERFAFFLYSFAIWDLFYYVFLKVLLNWPASLFTPDILFLIPVPWVGPVIAPCLVALTMILMAWLIIYSVQRNHSVKIKSHEWLLLAAGSLIIVLSFVLDYLLYVHAQNGLSTLWSLTAQKSLFSEAPAYIPLHFYWWIFWTGEFLLLFTIGLFAKRTISGKISQPISERTGNQILLTSPPVTGSPTESKHERFTDYFDGL